jgi:hypothetical protein
MNPQMNRTTLIAISNPGLQAGGSLTAAITTLFLQAGGSTPTIAASRLQAGGSHHIITTLC